jgi:8-oxo-dGTP diphosphatase
MKRIEVVAAIIIHKGLILCAQRNKSHLSYISEKFEFPGGKIETGETQIQALKRELKEELEIEPEIGNLFLTVTHSYPDFELKMHSYLCIIENKNIILKEHKSVVWLEKSHLMSLDWAAADLPIVQKLMNDE